MDVSINLAVDVCPNCGVVFAFPEIMEKDHRENHNTFYCPNGHNLSFVGKTEAEKLKAQLTQEKQGHAEEVTNLQREIRRARRQKRTSTKA